VTSPSGGESWEEGTVHQITWTSSHCTGSVRIELIRGGAVCLTLSSGTADDGTFSWTAANCADAEGGYTIRVTDVVTGSVSESGVFSVPEPPCLLAVTSRTAASVGPRRPAQSHVELIGVRRSVGSICSAAARSCRRSQRARRTTGSSLGPRSVQDRHDRVRRAGHGSRQGAR
jgi:hypothetical protein